MDNFFGRKYVLTLTLVGALEPVTCSLVIFSRVPDSLFMHETLNIERDFVFLLKTVAFDERIDYSTCNIYIIYDTYGVVVVHKNLFNLPQLSVEELPCWAVFGSSPYLFFFYNGFLVVQTGVWILVCVKTFVHWFYMGCGLSFYIFIT